MAKTRGKLIVVSGPSGVGKSTIDKEVVKRTGATFSVSLTTRQPRPDEIDGRDYRFVDRETFERMIERDRLLEWAEVFGNLYGTPAEPISRAIADGQTILLEIDVQGALQVYEKTPNATFVLIAPPSEEHLRERLRGRGTEDEKSFQERLDKAQEELRIARESGAYDYVVINEDLEAAIKQIVDIVEINVPTDITGDDKK